MGFRFNKRIKLSKGVSLNLSKSGVSTTIGTRGASINVGKEGAYLNTGIPGTGVSTRTKVSGRRKAKDSPEEKKPLDQSKFLEEKEKSIKKIRKKNKFDSQCNSVTFAIAWLIASFYLMGSESSIVWYLGLALLLASPFVIKLFFDVSVGVKNRVLELKEDEYQKISTSVKEHGAALQKNISRSIKYNDYGKIISDNSHLETLEFLDSIEVDFDRISEDNAIAAMYYYLDRLNSEQKSRGFDAESIPTDGHEFEYWVADQLNNFGWNARVTQGSGDQGIDVIAERDGLKAGIQCKLYSSSIGNKAVQEAFAGKSYHSLDATIVMSNAPFTKSAQNLAESTGVILASHYDIPGLSAKIEREFPARISNDAH